MDTLKLRCPTKLDSEVLLTWRNSSEVRKASGTQGYIQPDVHERWFTKRLDDLKRQPFWIVEHLHEPIGFIRFDLIENRNYEISIVISREFRGNGLGKHALNLAILRFQEKFENYTLTARIKRENLASLKLFSSSGFSKLKVEKKFEILQYKIFDH